MKYSAPYLRERSKKGKSGGRIPYYQGILRYKDESGIWRQITKTFDTPRKKEAKQMLQEWHEEMEEAASLNPSIAPIIQKKTSEQTVREAVSEFLDLQHAARRLEDSTYQTQCFYARKHIYPYLGHMSFATLTSNVIQNWEQELRTKLAENSVGACHSILRKTYKEAHRNGTISVNPFDFVTPPKKLRTEINYLNVTGKKKLSVALPIKWEEGSPLYTAVMLAMYTGMRSSEICALRWPDVKLTRGVEMLQVRSAIGRKPNGENYVKGTKNDSSRRKIPINSKVYEVLKARQTKMKEEYADSESEDKPSFNNLFVVGDIEGNYLPVTYLGSAFGRFTKENKINGVLGKPITMHGLRHTFATDAVKHGMDIKSLASILGHAKADMTLNIYASDDLDAVVLAMKKLSDAYEKEEESDF